MNFFSIPHSKHWRPTWNRHRFELIVIHRTMRGLEPNHKERSVHIYTYHTIFPRSHNVACWLCLSPNDNDSHPMTLYINPCVFYCIKTYKSLSKKEHCKLFLCMSVMYATKKKFLFFYWIPILPRENKIWSQFFT